MEKIKNCILGLSIFYMVLIIFLFMYNICNSVSSLSYDSSISRQYPFESKHINSYDKTLELYKEKIDKLKDGTCKRAISGFYELIKSENIKENDSIKVLYNYADDIINYNGFDRCDEDNNEHIDIYNTLVSYYNDLIYLKEILFKQYLYQYELGFKEYNIKKFDTNFTSELIYKTKYYEFKILDTYIDYLKNGEVN